MFNPILGDLVAREQNNDRLRQAEQSRLVKLALMRQPANRFNLRAFLGNRLMAVRHTIKALVSAGKTNSGSEMSAGRHRP
jgi:hypothetical protein